MGDGRCVNPRCVGYNTQCVHELLLDQHLIITKWDSRWLSNEKYGAVFGVSCGPTHLKKSPVQLVAPLPTTTTTVFFESEYVSN